ncbi:hypothetical protein S7711_10611 [Stachybotrys chartarum IBT 7711]|uniref:Uncharacterized protein n=1 Tax=Stachybotrys chartarum (strain CBS 109288 / IBT 7711) TaxID=1280523 RepID=A0A084AZ00_STACB|nr:hypothetical protein S7711_10611 [Stachybotrys chartarum IBT 7711]KFA54429.1 hypothetical protein S40293_10802 [Stachybotrys chartarum IBT 40293]KFA79839.1 hypothetical protein S40288_10513 [Stachybotrys chartarum IBT 40288]
MPSAITKSAGDPHGFYIPTGSRSMSSTDANPPSTTSNRRVDERDDQLVQVSDGIDSLPTNSLNMNHDLQGIGSQFATIDPYKYTTYQGGGRQ